MSRVRRPRAPRRAGAFDWMITVEKPPAAKPELVYEAPADAPTDVVGPLIGWCPP